MFAFASEPKRVVGAAGLGADRPKDGRVAPQRRSRQMSGPRYQPFGEGKLVDGWKPIQEDNKYFECRERPKAVYVAPEPKLEKATQIMISDPLLFDFENESLPLLQVLVARTIQQAKAETLQELVRKEKEEKFRRLSQRKHAALAETQRHLDRQRRLKEEQALRHQQRLATQQQSVIVHKKTGALFLAKSLVHAVVLAEQRRFSDRPQMAQLLSHLRAESVLHQEAVGGCLDRLVSTENRMADLDDRVAWVQQSLAAKHHLLTTTHIAQVAAEKAKKAKEKEELEEKIRLFNQRQQEHHEFLTRRNVQIKIRKTLMGLRKTIPVGEVSGLCLMGLGTKVIGEEDKKQVQARLPFDLCLYLVLMTRLAFGEESQSKLVWAVNRFLKALTTVWKVPVPALVKHEIDKLRNPPAEGQGETSKIPMARLVELCVENMVAGGLFPESLVSEKELAEFFQLILEAKAFKEGSEIPEIAGADGAEEPTPVPINPQLTTLRNQIDRVVLFPCVMGPIEGSLAVRVQKPLAKEPLEEAASDLLEAFRTKSASYTFDGTLYSQKAELFPQKPEETTTPIFPNTPTAIILYNKRLEGHLLKLLAGFLVDSEDPEAAHTLASQASRLLDTAFLEKIRQTQSEALIFDLEI